ncbi:flagellar biosynthesis anti-sigma factor FlgM [Halomonas sp. M20]|uniref:flagellar biosynthesis anti-sigma factor FlgM n=1 Tax=Halomonas sp. M20 TaxID=2763264 RepID=UPI001D0B1D0B|nr:flagellar biosynthesis anti-sigma factor FlgM [Halomonas sp. M20]
MKIDSNQPLHSIQQQDGAKKTAPQQKNDAGQAAAPSKASVSHLNSGVNDASHDVDAARVAEIRQAISEGRLEIRSERIADGLIDSVRDLLGRSE